MADLSLSGLASGFDWKSVVDQLVQIERVPEQRLRSDQGALAQRNSAYGDILTQVKALKTGVDALKDPSLFLSHSTVSGDSTIFSASADTTTPVGTYAFNISQLATASQQQGTANVGKRLSETSDVSGLVLSSAGFATRITDGTLTVNGKQVTIAASDTLQAVFAKINTATSGAVAGSYDETTDKISLSSTAPIVLGSANDTSNFFQAAKLYNNGTGAIASTASLGTVNLSSTLATANLSTAVSDGGSGSGEFKINGVSLSFNATTDTVSDVIGRINQSSAGVTASYDSINDRFLLVNKTTGDVGVAMEDVTGNFLAATGLSGGSLVRGNNLLFTLNGGATQVSRSNTISAADSGIPGLTVTAAKQGSSTISVAADTSKIKTAITDFIASYNKIQTLIDTQTASSTDSTGKVTAGILAADPEANEMASRLRSIVNQSVGGLSGTVRQLANLGINSNGTDNNLALTDSTQLDAALAGSLSQVKDLFSSTSGLAVSLSSYLDKLSGESGTLVTKQTTLSKQITDIDTQVSDMERFVLFRKDQMTQSFIHMETAQSNINQQLQFLQKRFG
jgi:flagellar hook-associated protein 2